MQHVACRLHGHCDGLDSSQVSVNINAVKAACQVCEIMWQDMVRIELKYEWELIREDFRNRTYIEYLKNFLNTSLITQQSFCMSGRANLSLREGLAFGGALCYTVNGEEGIYDEGK